MNVSKTDPLRRYSNPEEVVRRARRYLGKVPVLKSTRPTKKYMITYKKKHVHFGAMGYEDYTKHRNTTRRKNYLQRSAGIHGDSKYSANQLSRNLLW
jgi:hypothetical protein